MGLANGASRQWRAAHVHVGGASEVYSVCTRTSTAVQGLAVWRGAQARCDFAEALRFPAVLQCGAQQILLILLILLPSDCNNTEMFYNPEGNRK